jgi:hypothetical protein
MCVNESGVTAPLWQSGLFGEQESTEQVNCIFSSMHQTGPLYPSCRHIAAAQRTVASGQFRTHAPQQKRISFRLFDRVLMHINLHSPDGSAILSAFEAVVV